LIKNHLNLIIKCKVSNKLSFSKCFYSSNINKKFYHEDVFSRGCFFSRMFFLKDVFSRDVLSADVFSQGCFICSPCNMYVPLFACVCVYGCVACLSMLVCKHENLFYIFSIIYFGNIFSCPHFYYCFNYLLVIFQPICLYGV